MKYTKIPEGEFLGGIILVNLSVATILTELIIVVKFVITILNPNSIELASNKYNAGRRFSASKSASSPSAKPLVPSKKNAIHLTKSNKPHYFARKKEYV